MKTLKISKTPQDLKKSPVGYCIRCHGALVEEWNGDVEEKVHRCVLCGNLRFLSTFERPQAWLPF